MHFQYTTYMATPLHKNPCSGGHEIYNFLSPYPTDATYQICLRLAQFLRRRCLNARRTTDANPQQYRGLLSDSGDLIMNSWSGMESFTEKFYTGILSYGEVAAATQFCNRIVTHLISLIAWLHEEQFNPDLRLIIHSETFTWIKSKSFSSGELTRGPWATSLTRENINWSRL